ncbi:MAG: hypothetical protein AB7K71_37380 [Polyangiaceae bacterium]
MTNHTRSVWALVLSTLLLSSSACSELLGLESAGRRDNAAGTGGAGASGGGGVGGNDTAGNQNTGGVGAWAAGTGGGGETAGGAAGSTGAGGAAVAGGAAGAGAAGAAGAGAAGSGGAPGSPCVWEQLESPWEKQLYAGFENWYGGSFPTGWYDFNRHGSTGSYEKITGCEGTDGLRLLDSASDGGLHATDTNVSSGTPFGGNVCWLMRGYARFVSGATEPGSVGISLFNKNESPIKFLEMATSAVWTAYSVQFETSEYFSFTSVRVGMRATDPTRVTQVDFDNFEVWARPGPCD